MQLSLEQGHALQKDGLERVSANNQAFLALMRTEARRLSLERGYVTSDDLRVYASQLDLAPTHPNAWGSVFFGRRWKVIGRRKSAVPQGHGREIKIWAYVEQLDT